MLLFFLNFNQHPGGEEVLLEQAGEQELLINFKALCHCCNRTSSANSNE